jgi:hypothetical protein
MLDFSVRVRVKLPLMNRAWICSVQSLKLSQKEPPALHKLMFFKRAVIKLGLKV